DKRINGRDVRVLEESLSSQGKHPATIPFATEGRTHTDGQHRLRSIHLAAHHAYRVALAIHSCAEDGLRICKSSTEPLHVPVPWNRFSGRCRRSLSRLVRPFPKAFAIQFDGPPQDRIPPQERLYSFRAASVYDLAAA